MQVFAELALEIVADVLHHLLLGSGGEARHGYSRRGIFLQLVFPYELANVKVIHPEVLPPGGEAVGLVDDEPHHVACKQDSFDGLRP